MQTGMSERLGANTGNGDVDVPYRGPHPGDEHVTTTGVSSDVCVQMFVPTEEGGPRILSQWGLCTTQHTQY